MAVLVAHKARQAALAEQEAPVLRVRQLTAPTKKSAAAVLVALAVRAAALSWVTPTSHGLPRAPALAPSRKVFYNP
jgi:hypothetical protein